MSVTVLKGRVKNGFPLWTKKREHAEGKKTKGGAEGRNRRRKGKSRKPKGIDGGWKKRGENKGRLVIPPRYAGSVTKEKKNQGGRLPRREWKKKKTIKTTRRRKVQEAPGRRSQHNQEEFRS